MQTVWVAQKLPRGSRASNLEESGTEGAELRVWGARCRVQDWGNGFFVSELWFKVWV